MHSQSENKDIPEKPNCSLGYHYFARKIEKIKFSNFEKFLWILGDSVSSLTILFEFWAIEGNLRVNETKFVF